ncbi:peptidylprolyl isomerase [Thalassotalea crassostreae]|uniref:peptidylprolyl isomerase n=1 Tax=Thalassotalea crassostreae TaxID=1763536 RepID=UPI000838BC85|nr:peptidylprolyl isomerase [Thalassotalea crassostreae]
MNYHHIKLTAIFTLLFSIAMPSNATVVLFKTSMGDFEVNLLDEHTPKTVENFLEYVHAQDFDNSIIHRSVPGFIIQGGGYFYNTEEQMVDSVNSNPAVINEPVFSNVTGTIAMAKVSGDENSATNQWFFNVDNNSSYLDNENGGFTVFGVVQGDGLEILKTIEELDHYSIQNLPGFTDTPLRSVPDNSPLTDEHFVMIESIIVVNENVDTQPELPPLSTKSTPSEPEEENDSDSSGGSSTNLLLLAGLAFARFFRRS